MNNQVLGVATRVIVMAIVISVILLFLGIGAFIFIHVCVVGSAFRRGYGNSNAIERGASMSQGDLEKLPCFDFKAREKGTSPVDCAVCLENFKAGDKCRLLPLCKHSFHAECVDLWLLKTPICPICRTGTDAGKGGLVSGEESSRFSESGIELREQSQTADSGHLSEIAVELREDQTVESTHLSDAGVVEPSENQTILVGPDELSLNSTRLHGSPLETSL